MTPATPAATTPEPGLPELKALRALPRPLWLDTARRDQTTRWITRHGLPVQEYFRAIPELYENREDALVMICGEVQLRRELGETPTLSEYQSRYPDLSDELAIQFQLDEYLPDAHQLTDSLEREPSNEVASPPGYELRDVLGSGATGVVYRAWQASIDREVAIKVITGIDADSHRFRRQQREIQILALLHNPRVVQIYEAVHYQGNLYLVMELVEGSTLADATRDGPIDPRRAASIIIDLANTMDTIHRVGVTHRDLKPSNVLLSSEGDLKITDFGAAKMRAEDSTLTVDMILGTPSYMSPEQASGSGPIGPVSDVYSLGAMLYELLSGKPPFQAATILETLRYVLEVPPIPLQQHCRAVPRDLSTICSKCLAKQPTQRYATAGELADDLTRYMAGRPIRARQTSWVEQALLWGSRNPLTAALAVLLMVSLLGGFVSVAWQWQLAEQSRERAERERQVALSALQQANLAQRREAESRALAEQRADEIIQRQVGLQKAIDLMDQARARMDRKEWDGVEAAYTQALEHAPELATAYEERAELYLNLGLFDLAARDLLSARRLHPPPNQHQWFRLALLLRYLGDTTEYRKACQDMHDSSHLPGTIEWLRAATLDSDPPPEHQDFLLGASTLAPERHLDIAPRIRAAAHFRANQLAEAQAIIDSQAQSPQFQMAAPLQAMILHRLAQPIPAQEALARATATYDQWFEQILVVSDPHWVLHKDAGTHWPLDPLDWLEFHLQYLEAHQTITGSVRHDARIPWLRARGLASLRRTEPAIAEYKLALTIDADNPRCQLELHRTQAFEYTTRLWFPGAAEHYAAAVQLDPQDSALWRFQATAYLTYGSLTAYHDTCHRMLTHFESSPTETSAFNLVYAWTSYPATRDDWKQILRLAEAPLSLRSDLLPFLARAFYRANDYQRAVDLFRTSQRHVPLSGCDLLFYALSLHELGDQAGAREQHAKALAWIKTANSPSGDEPSRWGAWTDRVHTLLIQLEAQRCLTPATHTLPASTPPQFESDRS